MSRGAHLHLLSSAASSGSPAAASCRATNSNSSRTRAYAQLASDCVIRFIDSFLAPFGERITRDAVASLFPIADATVDRVVRSPEVERLLSFNTAMGKLHMRESIEPPKRQHVSTSGNQQGIDADGFDLALLSPTQLQAYSHSKALGEAIRHDPRTDQQIARHARISKGHLSKLRTGLWEEQANRMQALLLEVGHIGPAQKLLFDLGFEVKRRKPRRKTKEST